MRRPHLDDGIFGGYFHPTVTLLTEAPLLDGLPRSFRRLQVFHQRVKIRPGCQKTFQRLHLGLQRSYTLVLRPVISGIAGFFPAKTAQHPENPPPKRSEKRWRVGVACKSHASPCVFPIT
jgi:hypothetical protein